MSFEYISSAVSVARQQMLWGFLVGGLGVAWIAFILARGKRRVMLLGGIALLAAGGWFVFQSWQLGRSEGEWRIVVDDSHIDWQSPNEAVDPSFTVPLDAVDYLDRGARASRADERPLYHLVLKDDSAIALNPVSGVDLAVFSTYLASVGIETRQTNRFHLPMELRNK